MEQLDVKTSTNNYKVTIDEGLRLRLLDYIPKQYSTVFIVTDQTVAELYLDEIIDQFHLDDIKPHYYVVPSGEASKGIDMYYTLQTKLLEANMDRRSLIIALGGGVVGDLSGFVAATYMRGIDYIQMPTTILAHDSSVGGKVAINHELGKNMIGSFYPPAAVLYDVATLRTLPEHEIRSGYAELVKEAFISDIDFLDELMQVSLSNNSTKQMQNHLYRGIQVKRDIVEQDEKEANIRMFLNFGHTLAHAIETELGYGKMTHGEAVAIGMLFALRKSQKNSVANLQYDELLQWLRYNNYPLQIEKLDIQRLIQHMKKDKKTTSQHIQMVLLEKIGTPIVQMVSDDELYQDLIDFKKELNTL